MKRFLSTLVLATLMLAVFLPSHAFAQDSDGDGVLDSADLCPAEDANRFDADGDGCIDPTANWRHVEYWAAEDLPMLWVMSDQNTTGLDPAALTIAVTSGFDTWAAVPGIDFNHSFEGTVAAADGDATDGVNLVSFSDAFFGDLYGNTVIAVGITTSLEAPGTYNGRDVRAGQIVDADMLFNPARTFNFSGEAGVDVQSVAAHEAGHLLGISHSTIESATMFPALPRGIAGRSLTADDELVAFMAYPDAAALATATELRGSLLNGLDLNPIAGAAIFLISAASGDTVGATFTRLDGSYAFVGVAAGDYFIAAHPLDGGVAIKGVTPGFINDLVEGVGVTLFVPESWDLAESGADNSVDRDALTLVGGSPVFGIDILSNVDTTPPSVVSNIPGTDAVEIPVGSVMAINPSEGIQFATATSRVHLEHLDGSGGVVSSLGGRLNYLGREFVLIFNPDGQLSYSTDYRMTLETGVEDLFGNPTAADFSYEFRTADPPPAQITGLSPPRGAVGAKVTISGAGLEFGGGDRVTFDGWDAAVLSVADWGIVVEVPDSASSGDIAVVVENAGSPLPARIFTVIEPAGALSGNLETRVSLSSNPIEVAQLPDGNFAYVATDGGVDVVGLNVGSTQYGQLVATIPIEGGADGIVSSPDGQRIYAVAREASEIWVIDAVYGDLIAPSASFNEVVDVLEVGSRPLGIAMDPMGRRIWVPTDAGRVQGWDTDRAVLLGGVQESPTYHRQIASLVTPAGEGLEGSISVGPDGTRLYVLAGSGDVFLFEADADLAFLGGISSHLDAADLMVDPFGHEVLVSHRTGHISVLDLTLGVRTSLLAVGGRPRGIAMMPAADRIAYADRLDDRSAFVGNLLSQPGFHEVDASVASNANPVDILPSPGGDGYVVLEQGTASLAIFSVGQGPIIRGASHFYMPPGGGFFKLRVDPPAGQTQFNFQDTHYIRLPDGTDILAEKMGFTIGLFSVELPAGFFGGELRFFSVPDGEAPPLDRSVGGTQTSHIKFSNGISVLPTTPRPLFSGLVEIDQRFVQLGPDIGYDFQTSTNGPFFGQRNAISPDGFLGFFEVEGQVRVLDLNPNSTNFEMVIGNLFPQNGVVSYGFDKERQNVLLAGGNTIEVFGIDPNSPNFLQSRGIVGNPNALPLPGSVGQGSFHDILTSPYGDLWICTDVGNGSIYIITESISEASGYEIQQRRIPPGAVTGSYMNAAFSGDGNGLYVIFATGTSGQMWIVDTEPGQEGIYSTASVLSLPHTPKGIRFRQDAPVGYLITHDIVGVDELTVWTITGSPFNASLTDSVEFEGLGGSDVGHTTISPNMRTLVHETGFEAVVMSLPENSDPLVTSTYLPTGVQDTQPLLNTSPVRGMAFSADGSTGYLAGGRDWNMFKLNDDPGESLFINVISGEDQTGAAGELLAAPIRAQLAWGDGTPKANSSIIVTVGSGGGTVGDGNTTQIYRTDAHGLVTIHWTLGSDASALQELEMREQDIGAFTIFSVFATALDDPGLVDLQLVQRLPAMDATNVNLQSSLSLTFNQAVDVLTVDASTISLRESGSANPLAVAYGFANQGRTVSLTPLLPLSPTTVHEVTVGAGLMAVAGSAVANPGIASFTTSVAPPLAIASVSPTGATVGSPVVIGGTSFSETAGLNRVFFGATETTSFSSSGNSIQVTVPPGAETGSIRVEVGAMVSDTLPFNVLVVTNQPVSEVIGTLSPGVSLSTLAVLPDGSKAYSVDTENDALLPLDLVNFIDLAPVPVGNEPVSVVVSPDGSRVYVANFASGTISVLSTGSDNLVATVPVGLGPLDLAMHPDGDRVYVVNSLGGTLDVIDSSPGSATYHTVTNRISTGSTSKGAVISPDGGTLYVGTADGYLVIDLDPTSFGVTNQISTGSTTKGASVSPDGGLLILVTAEGEVLIVDISPGGNNTVVSRVNTGSSTSGASVSPDGGLLYLIQEDSDEILVAEIDIFGSFAAIDEVLGGLEVRITIIGTVSVGDDPSALVFDSSTGRLIVANGTEGQVTVIGRSEPTEIGVALRVTPRTLNLKSKGRFVTAHIELPAGVGVADIDLSSIRLNGILEHVEGKESWEDEDGDGLIDLTLKFDRLAFQATMPHGESVPVELTGLMVNGITSVVGHDAIRTIRPTVISPAGGENFAPGQQITLAWQSPSGVSVSTADVYWTADDGESWAEIDSDISGTEQISWTVPYEPTDFLLIQVTLYDDLGDDVGLALSPSHARILDIPVAARVPRVMPSVEDGQGVLRWELPASIDEVGFHVLAAESSEGRFQQITQDPVLGGEFRDASLEANRNRWYQLEDAETGFVHGPWKLSWVLKNALEQNVPNSFNPKTEIRFSIAQRGPVSLVVYNLAGRVVNTLIADELAADNYRVSWDGKDGGGQSVASGIYVYRLVAPGFVAAKRMTLVR